MVVFTCFYCGESVKKPSVSKHYLTKCRNKDPYLTCVDCLKDFKGNDHEGHTKCVTEDERYSAKGYVPKPSQNKGERKQQAWQECIQTVLKKPSLKQDERDLIKAISKYENVPRKKAKFITFLSNGFKQYANKNDLIDRVWTEMESVFKEMLAKLNEAQQQQKEENQQESQKNSKKVSPETEEPEVKKEKKRKRKAEESEAVETSGLEKVNDDKLKKKKAKHNDENVVEGDTDMLPVEKMGDQQEKKTRKRKAGKGNEAEQNGSVADEAESEKKKKKKKHEKLVENVASETSAQGNELESKSKKKNKKSKNSNAEAKPNEGEMTAVDTKSIKKEKKSENKENCMEKVTEANSEGDVQTEKADSKKKKTMSDGDADKPGIFDWKAAILQVLNQEGKNNRIQLQKLQKKVLKLHCQTLKCQNSEKKGKKFMRKLKDMTQIEIDDDFVVLKS